MGRTDVADALLRLDKLTQEEIRMVAAQNLKATHGNLKATHDVDDKVTALGNKMCGVDDKQRGVEKSLRGIGRKFDRVLISTRIVFS